MRKNNQLKMATIIVKEYINKHKINVVEYIDKEKWLYFTKLSYTTQKGEYREKELIGCVDTENITKQKLASWK